MRIHLSVAAGPRSAESRAREGLHENVPFDEFARTFTLPRGRLFFVLAAFIFSVAGEATVATRRYTARGFTVASFQFGSYVN